MQSNYDHHLLRRAIFVQESIKIVIQFKLLLVELFEEHFVSPFVKIIFDVNIDQCTFVV